MLLDEALAGLRTDELRAVVARLRASWADATLIHVTHDVASTRDFDRVLVMEEGRIVQDGDPDVLRAEPAGRYATLLADQQRLAARVASFGGCLEDAQATSDPVAGCRPVAAGLLRARVVVVPALAALGAGAFATLLLIDGADRLGRGVAGPGAAALAWAPGVVVALLASAVATGATLIALGHATVALGTCLRERALRSRAGAVGERTDVARSVGRVLDLEQFETVVLGSGALIALAAVEELIAAVVLFVVGGLTEVAVLAVAVVVLAGVGRALRPAGRRAAQARAAVTEHYAGRLLALRTVTIQENPEREREHSARLLDDVEQAHAAVDRRRVLLAAALPRAALLALLGSLALRPPDGVGATAGVLGAMLIAFGALERIGHGLADLAPGLAAADGARALLTGASVDDAAAVTRVPAPEPGHVLHQPLAANALLGSGTWPPSDAQLGALSRTLRAVGLDDVVERMPLGIGQPLGETGWRLSQGEQARLVVTRALLGRGDALEFESVLSALDPTTAHLVLDALDADPRPVRLA